MIMKNLLHGLFDTYGRLYISLVYKMPVVSPFAGFRYPIRVSTKPFLGRNEL
jgi:hypothetical protein